MRIRSFHGVGALILLLLATLVARCAAPPERSSAPSADTLRATSDMSRRTAEGDTARTSLWDRDPEDVQVRLWTTQDGLPVNFIQAIAQTPDGYLWVGTGGGLLRFDGLHFRLYNKDDLVDWTSPSVKTLTVTSSGRLIVVGLMGEVAVVESGSLRTILSRRNGLPESARGIDHDNVLEGEDGTLWIALGGSLARVNMDGKAEVLHLGDREVLGAAMAEGNALFVVTDEQLLRYANGHAETIQRFSRPSDIFSLPPGGEFYIAFTDGTLLRVGRNGRVERRRVQPPGSRPRPLREEPDGSLLLDTEAGLVRVAPGDTTKAGRVLVPAAGMLRDQDGWSVTRLGKQVAWIVPGEQGRAVALAVLGRDGQTRDLPLPAGIDLDKIVCALEGQSGEWWIGTTGGLLRYSPRRARALTRANGLASAYTFTTLADRAGQVWIGTWGGGLNRVRPIPGRPERAERIVGAPARIRALLQDTQGRIWAGGMRDVAVLREGRVVRTMVVSAGDRFTQLHNEAVMASGDRVATFREVAPDRFDVRVDSSLMMGSIRVLHEDRRGRLWRSDDQGLTVRLPGQTAWRRVPGVSAPVMSLYENASGDFFVGTRGAGLVRFFSASSAADLSHLRTFTYTKAAHRLHHDGIWWIEKDRAGDLWMTSDAGLGRYRASALDSVAAGQKPRLDPLVLTMADGLPSEEFDSGQPGGTQTADGRLWFPTASGVAIVDPAGVVRDTRPVPVVLEGVVADGVESDTLPPVVPAGTRSLTFRYTALDLVRPEGVRFRYRLDGLETAWTDAGARREAVYSNLAPGRYTFRVVAMNGDGVWNEVGAAHPFRLAPLWWQTLWARLGLLLVVGGVAALAWRWKATRMRTVELRGLVDTRTAELREERDRVAAQSAEIADAHERLKALDHLKADLVANVSHEFRTPLMLVLGHLRDVLATGAVPPEAVPRLEAAAHGAERLERLVGHLIETARMQAERRPLDARPGDLAAFAEAVVAAFTPVARRAGVDVSCTADGPLPVAFEADAMESVLANLVSNAVKFTPPGGHVRVSLGREGGQALVRVRDTGVGLDGAALARVFDRFFQADTTTTRPADGAGLGLALAADFARLHGGTLTAESDGAGFGSTFTLRLPLLGDGADEPGRNGRATGDAGQDVPEEPSAERLRSHLNDLAAHRAVASSMPAETPSSPKGTSSDERPLVLVVDDNAEVRALLALQLDLVARVVEATDGRGALALARREMPDGIVCDVMMPGMDGPAFLDALRADEDLGSVPLLFLTAKGTREDEMRALEHGADDYLVKPFPADVLRARVVRMIDRHRAVRARYLADAPNGAPCAVPDTGDAAPPKRAASNGSADGHPPPAAVPHANAPHAAVPHTPVTASNGVFADADSEPALVSPGAPPPPASSSAAKAPFVRRAEAVVDARLSEWTFGADAFADELATSVATLNRRLKPLTGMAAATFIRERRLAAACRHLEAGRTVKHTAHAVGFRDAEYFSRLFRQRHGVSPSDWPPSHDGDVR